MLFPSTSSQGHCSKENIVVNNFVASVLSTESKQFSPWSRLDKGQVVILALGFLVIVMSIVLDNPVLAGSLFLALSAMMFDQYLTSLVKKLNSCIKLWQVFVAIALAAVFVSRWVNPANI